MHAGSLTVPFINNCPCVQDVSREQMGAYLCIASNKVPPSVSKRIKLVVECEFKDVKMRRSYSACSLEKLALRSNCFRNNCYEDNSNLNIFEERI
jgi:hypothetical protein